MFKNPNYVYGPKDVFVPAKLNFGEYFLDKLWQFKEKICLINGATHEALTYGEIAQQGMNLAVSLRRMGVQKGQTVAICSENRLEYWGTVVGVVCAGAVLTTINIGYSRGELKHVMNISRPKYIFCSPLAFKTHEKNFKSLDFVKKIIMFGDEERPDNTLMYNDLAKVSKNGLETNVSFEDFEAVDVEGQSDTLMVLYSSGTTGLPKGVKLTHYNVITACELPSSHVPSLLTLTITPWYHVMGLVGNIVAMVTGRTGIYLAKFDLELYLKTIERYKVSQLTVVPPVLVALSKVRSKYDTSSVQLVYSGAAPLHRDTLEALTTVLPNAVVLQGYGMTEVTLAVTRDTHDKVHLAKPGGVGYVIAGSVVKVVDTETRQPLGPHQRGEICIKGCNLMKGYLGKDPREDLDDEGFYKTGDIGYYDDDKYFFIVDRLKELIKYKGYQVPPAEIEAVLLQHEGVKDVGVVGVDHRVSGEVPVAFVVKQQGVHVTEKELKEFVADRLSNPKHLRGGVRFVELIPKSPSGKILRKDLKKMAKSGKSKL